MKEERGWEERRWEEQPSTVLSVLLIPASILTHILSNDGEAPSNTMAFLCFHNFHKTRIKMAWVFFIGLTLVSLFSHHIVSASSAVGTQPCLPRARSGATPS